MGGDRQLPVFSPTHRNLVLNAGAGNRTFASKRELGLVSKNKSVKTQSFNTPSLCSCGLQAV